MAKAGVHAVKEPHGLCHNDSKRPDGATLLPWKSGKCLLWDATIPDTLAKSHIHKTSKQAGVAAEEAAQLKINKYQELVDRYIFVPVAIETLGSINEEGCNFLEMLGKKIRDVTYDNREAHYLFQRLSVAIQKGNAASFAGCFEEHEAETWS